MLRIALIDDKSYGLDLIRSLHTNEECSIDYFSSFREFQSNGGKYDIAYLDYYLDHDGITGDAILPEVKMQAEKIIGFSSVPGCNRRMVELGADGAVDKS